METADFKELYRKIVDRFKLDPSSAERLLQKILAGLEIDALYPEEKREILSEYLEREEIPWVSLQQE